MLLDDLFYEKKPEIVNDCTRNVEKIMLLGCNRRIDLCACLFILKLSDLFVRMWGASVTER